MFEIIILGGLAGAIGGMVRYARGQEEAKREKRHRSSLHHHDGVWHDHTHDGRHRHPHGDDRFVYIPKEETRPRRPSDDLYLPPSYREQEH